LGYDQSEYKRKQISPEAAAALVQSGSWVDYGFGIGQPDRFDAALAARRDELRGVRIRACLCMRPRAVLEQDPEGRAFQYLSWHFSGYERRQHDAGQVGYIPFNFGEGPALYRRFLHDEVDLACLKVAPIDDAGRFNFSVANTYLRAVCDVAKKIVVEVDPSLPVARGSEDSVHLSEVDGIIDAAGAGSPLPELPNPPVSEVDRQVAVHVLSLIEDGACLQVGVGAMPNAVCSELARSGLRDLGVHTEMMVDGIVDLYESGAVTGIHKTSDPGKLAYTFAAGSQRLYAFLDDSPVCAAHPVDYTNLPERIARNAKVFSINNTTQIDLQGQACSESAGFRHLTGTGGQLQFVRGAFASRGGRSVICLSSTYERGETPVSRIVTTLTPGNVVTTPRTDVMYIVTEYGIACLKGRSVGERARALIDIAHPRFREGLEREAREKKILSRELWPAG
jgi:acyl-CoA hydrolase